MSKHSLKKSSQAPSKIDDAKLINNVKFRADSESFTMLDKMYSNVFYKICHKFTPALSAAGIDVKDIFDEKNIVLLNCIKTFNPKKKTKFSTYLGNYARFLCLNSLNSRKRQLPMDTDDLFSFIEDVQAQNECDNNPNCDKEELLKEAIQLLKDHEDPRLYEVFKLRLLYEEKKPTWKIISKKMNISSQTAINIFGRALDYLRDQLLRVQSQPNKHK